MSEPIQLILQMTLKEGKEAEFQTLCGTVPGIVQENEPGTTEYLWLREGNAANCMFLDRYASSEAFLAHLQAMQEGGHLDAIMGCLEVDAVHCIGTPTDAAKDALDGFGARYMNKVAGFTRVQVPDVTATH